MRNVAPKQSSDKWIAFGFGAVMAGLFAAEILRDVRPQRLGAPIFLAAWIVLIAIHELGHAVVARLVGWRVIELVIGFGPVVADAEFRGTRVRIHLFPISGFIRPAPTQRGAARAALAAIYLAGPVVELLAAAAVGFAIGWDTLLTPSGELGVITAQAFAAAAVLGAAVNLIPLRTGDGHTTDGLGVVLAAFMPTAHFDGLRAAPLVEDGERLLAAGEGTAALALFEAALTEAPDVLALHIGVARSLAATQRTGEALMCLAAVARDPSRSRAWRATAQAALVDLREGRTPEDLADRGPK